MKRTVLLPVALLMLLMPALAFAEYDRDLVVDVMRNNVAYLGETREAAENGDYFAAAESLFAMASGMKQIMEFTPPRGEQEDFAATIREFINTAYMGIGACGEEDAEALGTAIAKLRQLNQQGHREYKPPRA